MEGKIKDIGLAETGQKKIEWAQERMPVMQALREKYSKSKPLKGARISGCLHVTKETAVLIETLVAAGAEVAWSGCNPLSTQDEVAAALYKKGIPIWAWHGMNTEEFYWAIEKTIEQKPTMTLDDGADLIFTLHNKFPEVAKQVFGGSEETTTGVHRLRAMGKDGALLYPVIAVNDAETKWDFDNIYGTGQSSIDGILRATNILMAGKNFVVAGYGHCGKGAAMRASGQGSNVIITEVKPTAALKAKLDGYRVMPMDKAATVGDVFITATGMKDVIVKRHFKNMKSGAIVCNTGHYDCELNLEDLNELTQEKKEVRPNCMQHKLSTDKTIYLLGEGRLVNLVAAEGHPSEVMDMSFANQFLSMLRIFQSQGEMDNTVYDISEEQDQQVAELKLKTMGIEIDDLTPEQLKYKNAYNEGT
ncbi:MAG: adenosylhomocysteinase [Candidatus Marinimicrobia bacterium]|nr:adenosylhomocysteinase [Candidatus Neomarinimicrobiota bacterium]